VLRITCTQDVGSRQTHRLEGRLVGPWVGELRRLCFARLEDQQDLTLDLTGLIFLDREGVALLRDLLARGVGLEGGSRFVTELVRGST